MDHPDRRGDRVSKDLKNRRPGSGYEHYDPRYSRPGSGSKSPYRGSREYERDSREYNSRPSGSSAYHERDRDVGRSHKGHSRPPEPRNPDKSRHADGSSSNRRGSLASPVSAQQEPTLDPRLRKDKPKTSAPSTPTASTASTGSMASSQRSPSSSSLHQKKHSERPKSRVHTQLQDNMLKYKDQQRAEAPSNSQIRRSKSNPNSNIDAAYFEGLRKEVQEKRKRLIGIMSTLGLDHGLANISKDSMKSVPAGYPIPFVDRVLENRRVIELEGDNEKPVYELHPAFLDLRNNADTALFSEATAIINNNKGKSTPKFSASNKPKLATPKILVRLGYIKALQGSIRGDSFTNKGGLEQLPHPSLSFSLAASHLENYIRNLKVTKQKIIERHEELKNDVLFEESLNHEIMSINHLAVENEELTRQKTKVMSDSTKNNSGTQNEVVLTGLATRLHIVRDEVTRLMGCLKFLIEDHLAPFVAANHKELARAPPILAVRSNSKSAAHPSMPRKSNGVHADHFNRHSGNGVPGSNMLKEPSIITIDEPPQGNNSKYVATITNSPSVMPFQSANSIPKELVNDYDASDAAQVSQRMKALVIFFLNQLMDSSSSEKDVYLQVPSLDDPVLKLLLRCQIITQAPHAPMLVKLREFGQSITSSKLTIQLP